MKTLGCHAEGCDLHVADHKKLSKILIQAPIRSDCVWEIYVGCCGGLKGRMRSRAEGAQLGGCSWNRLKWSPSCLTQRSSSVNVRAPPSLPHSLPSLKQKFRGEMNWHSCPERDGIFSANLASGAFAWSGFLRKMPRFGAWEPGWTPLVHWAFAICETGTSIISAVFRGGHWASEGLSAQVAGTGSNLCVPDIADIPASSKERSWDICCIKV